MRSMVEHVHQQIKDLQVDIAVDFTMGNGYDTFVLSNIAKQVYSFDVQDEALKETKKKLIGIYNVKLIKENHLHFDKYVDKFDIGIFNLGYLPNSNHSITTEVRNTMQTIEKAVALLNPGGLLYMVIYIGHEEGQKEAREIESYVQQLHHRNYNIAKFSMLNKRQAPYVIEVEKR